MVRTLVGEMEMRPLPGSGWSFLYQRTVGGGLPVAPQSRERGSPCEAAMVGGSDAEGGTGGRGRKKLQKHVANEY